MRDISPHCLWHLRAQLGEGPIWHAAERAVYFVDIKGRRIHRWSVDAGRGDSWPTPGQPGFLVPVDDARFICGSSDGLSGFEPSAAAGAQFIPLLKVEPEFTGNRLNDGHVDARGRLWFGTMDDNESQPTGTLYTLGDEGVLVAHDRGHVIANGPAMSPDGRTLYHTDTLACVVHAYDVADDGSLARKRAFLRLGDADPTNGNRGGYPDGMAVDAQGCLWVCYFGGWRIDRFSPQGQRMGSVGFPCANVTKLAFGDDDLRTVYVTTATKGLSPDELLRQPLAGGLFAFRSPTPGLPQHRCKPGYPAHPGATG